MRTTEHDGKDILNTNSNFIFLIKSYFSSVVSLWIIDILVNLKLSQRYFTGGKKFFIAGVQDLGIIVPLIQICFFTTIASFIIAKLYVTFRKNRNFHHEHIKIQAAIMSALSAVLPYFFFFTRPAKKKK